MRYGLDVNWQDISTALSLLPVAFSMTSTWTSSLLLSGNHKFPGRSRMIWSRSVSVVTPLWSSYINQKKQHTRPFSIQLTLSFSPNTHIQILETDRHTFPLRISWENLIKDQDNFSVVIILLILTPLSLDHVRILLGENWCWSLLGLKGLNGLLWDRH